MLIILISVLSGQEKDLVNDIFEEYHALFFNVTLAMLDSHADAEDAVSAAYVKIMNNIEKISKLPCPQIAPYCVVIVKNTAIDIIRKRKHEAHFEDIDSIGDVNSNEEIWKNVEIQELTAIIPRLSKEERYILQLHYGSGVRYAEIAVLLEINEETAKKRGQRALKKLRELFEEGAYHADSF